MVMSGAGPDSGAVVPGKPTCRRTAVMSAGPPSTTRIGTRLCRLNSTFCWLVVMALLVASYHLAGQPFTSAVALAPAVLPRVNCIGAHHRLVVGGAPGAERGGVGQGQDQPEVAHGREVQEDARGQLGEQRKGKGASPISKRRPA